MKYDFEINRNLDALKKKILLSSISARFSYLEETSPILSVITDQDLTEEESGVLTTLVTEAEIIVPFEITPRQARQALLTYGITSEAIVTAINTLSSPTKEKALIEWEYSIAFQRNNPLVGMVGQMLGWSSSQLDALWVLGGTL